jgi:glycine betaine/choline ABC-type transport system substrate-binding protein
MRLFRTAALGATSLALVLSACTSGGGSTPSPAASTATSPSASTAASGSAEPSTSAEASPSGSADASAPSGPTLASTLVLAGPPECPERPFCLIGLQETYGLEFKEFRPTDAGGPITVQALTGGDAQVGLLFTSDPAIAVNDFVLLEDDKGLQLADNIIPVLRQEVLDANPGVEDLLNTVMERLTQEELTALNQAVTVDQQDVADVASEWITSQNFDSMSAGLEGDITVGSTNFYEQEILAEIFAQMLESNGATVERKFQLGNREVVMPALEAGEIDVLAEYAATALEFVNDGAGEATTDAQETAELLRERLAERELTALEPAEATDQNGFVVTRETADQYGLTKLSDLAQPAP